VHYVPYTGEMVTMAVELPKRAHVKDLKKVVGERMNVDPATVTHSR